MLKFAAVGRKVEALNGWKYTSAVVSFWVLQRGRGEA
jgi:hypothetical protein